MSSYHTPPSHPGRRIGARAGLAALALAVLTAAGQPALAQQGEEVRDTFGDWTLRCASGTDACVMQQVGKGDQGNDVLEMRIRKLDGVTTPEGEAIPAAIQILAPLGVLLPAGVRVVVDNNEQRSAPFEVCAQGGCVVRQPMSTDFLDEMKAGSAAQVTVIAAPQNEVSVRIGLSGFTRAFNALQP